MSEFYIGYLPKAPAGIHRRVLTVVVLLLGLGAACAFFFAKSQRTFSPSAFEFGHPRTFEGVIGGTPYPTLAVRRPGIGFAGEEFSTYLLVATGKHGAKDQVAGYNGENVRLRGQLIYRDKLTMIELTPDSITKIPGSGASEKGPVSLGSFDLTGEIVDAKCFLGVMNPGNSKVHRDCAVRCISGGLPPALATRDLDGTPSLLLLTDLSNNPLAPETFLDRVGQPVRIRGQVLRLGDMLFLETQPSAIAALP